MPIKKGDLVSISNSGGDPVIEKLLHYNGVHAIVGVILQCRYKKNVYLFKPANSPFTDSAYWIEGRYLLPYEG